MSWCLISGQTAKTNLALEWLKKWHSMIGAFHDQGANTLHCHCPPAELLVGIEEKLIFDDTIPFNEAVFKMIRQAATFMLSTSTNVMTGESWMFESMYKTAYHEIWCKRFTDGEDYKQKYILIFGIEPGEVTQEQASQQIKAYFS
jgi:hypothetical protein